MKTLATAVALALALTVAGGSLAATAKRSTSYRVTMTPRQEVPPPAAPAGAAGVFTATVADAGALRSIRWTLTFRNLSGKAVAAHIHAGKRGVAGGVLLALCAPCKTGATGRATIAGDTADALERGTAYVNVHTAKNAAGEIRGQIVKPAASVSRY